MTIELGCSSILTRDFLPLYRNVMARSGEAAQTYAAITRHIPKGRDSTFVAVSIIAETACLTVRTVRRHIGRLLKDGWLKRRGREPLARANRWRRTVTYVLPEEMTEARGDYFGVLPRWACDLLPQWSERAIFAVAVSQWLQVEAIESAALGCADGRDLIRRRIVRQWTGLSEKSVRTAAQRLCERGFLCSEAVVEDCSSAPALLWLNHSQQLPESTFEAAPIRRRSSPPLVNLSHSTPAATESSGKQAGKSVTDPLVNLSATPAKSVTDPRQICPTPLVNVATLVMENSYRESPTENPLCEKQTTDNMRCGATHAVTLVSSTGNAPRNGARRKAIEAHGDRHGITVERWRKKLKYAGEDIALLWKLAALEDAIQISPDIAHSSVAKTAIHANGNPMAYLRTCLNEALGEDHVRQLLATVKVPPGIRPATEEEHRERQLRLLKQMVAAESSGNCHSPGELPN